LPVGVVENVVPDPERDSFIDVIVTPAAHLDRLDEVLVVTSTQPRFSPEQQQDLATSEALKGSEAAAIKEQKKASEIMAERLPGLVDPNLPPDQQPLHDSSNPTPVAHPPQALHPDRFTPGNAPDAASEATPEALPHAKAPAVPDSVTQPKPKTPVVKPSGTPSTTVGKPTSKPAQPKQTGPQTGKPPTNQPQKAQPGGNT